MNFVSDFVLLVFLVDTRLSFYFDPVFVHEAGG